MWTALLLMGSTMASDLTADDLAWLSGTWVQDQDGRRVEETWTLPNAGTLFGINRTARGEATTFHEFLRIENRSGTLTYVAQPKGAQAETPFAAAEHGNRWVVFTNPEHDFPTSLRYERNGNTLQVEVRGPDGKGFDLNFKRVRKGS